LNEREYEKLAAVEDSMWWFRALHKNVLALIERLVTDRSACLLDAGCGTGGVLRAVHRAERTLPLYGIDIFTNAAARAADSTDAHVAVASVNALPFPPEHFGCILSIDVICQRGVDASRAIGEFHRCLVPGGIVIIQVPAYRWLWGYHDVQCHTADRFTRKRLGALLRAHQFQIRFATYWNAVLLPLLAVRRKLLPLTHGASDVKEYAAWVDANLGAVVSLECRLIRRGFALPFGSSVLVAAQKAD
jgi:SAM-dependent methyltransferase